MHISSITLEDESAKHPSSRPWVLTMTIDFEDGHVHKIATNLATVCLADLKAGIDMLFRHLTLDAIKNDRALWRPLCAECGKVVLPVPDALGDLLRALTH